VNENILPDSRLATVFTAKNARPGPLGFMVPIYCGSCGVEGGQVPEENMTFAYWLCKSCFAKYGEVVNTYVMPDEVFWRKLNEEQLEAHGRLLTGPELLDIVAADSSPLATLIKEGRPTGG
jgi:hypothetical protein